MWKVAALAWMPISAVLFGGFIVTVTQMPWLLRDFTAGATAIHGAAALSILLAVPLSWWVARRMLTRREKHLMDVMAGRR